jgi:hypothetical protein
VIADKWSLSGLVKSTMVKPTARMKDMDMAVAYSKTELIMKENGVMIYVLEREVKSIETNMNISETT